MRLKNYENLAKKIEEELQNNMQHLNSIKNQFTEGQKAEFNEMQKLNTELSKECQELENEISIWRCKKSEIEQKTGKEESLLKMEMLQSIGKVRHLEKQKHELLSSDSSEENERAHLLAQVKRHNNYIALLETKLEQHKKALEEVNNEIDFYRDGERMVKFTDIKQKEKSYEEFMNSFTSDKDGLLNKMETANNEVNDITGKLARSLKYLSILKQISDVSTG